MALKLPLPLPGADPAALRRTGAKLRAWWTGSDPVGPDGSASTDSDPPASPASPATVLPAGVDDPDLSAMVASEALWGAGRLEPVDGAIDVGFAGALGLTRGRRLALFGPDLGQRALACVRELGVKVDQFIPDPRQLDLTRQTLAAHRKLARDIVLHGFDGAPGSAPKNRSDGVMFMLACPSPEEAEVAAFTAERILRPGGTGLIFDLFARRDDDPMLDPCRGPEGRHFLDEDAVTGALEAAGLELRGQEDRGADLLNGLQVALDRIREDFAAFQAGLLATGGALAAAGALDRILLWRARADAVRAGRLTARRIVFHLPK